MIRGLATALPPSLAGVAPPGIDGRVLLFTLVVALTTSMVFGIWPALSASQSDLSEAMKSAGAGRRRLTAADARCIRVRWLTSDPDRGRQAEPVWTSKSSMA